MEHLPLEVLEAGLSDVIGSPRDAGRIELVVRRPAENERELLTVASLDPDHGLVGDRWGPTAANGGRDPRSQLTLINARLALLVAGSAERRALAGDQLFVDFDLSVENIPPGTRLRAGSAVLEVTDLPHRGCGKFAARFGVDASKFVNSRAGRELNLRGINARVRTGGSVSPGDMIAKAG